MPALAARVAAGAVALALAVLVGVRWADSTAPAAPRDLPGRPLPAGQEVPIPVDRGPSLTEVDVPARAQADEMLRRAVRATADWAAVLRELDERRARALAGGHAAGLTLVYAAGSSALREDASDVARLAAAGVRARGLRLVISSVRLRDTAPGRVVLDVRDRMPAYDIVDISGKVVRRLPGRGDRSWQVTLVPSYDVEGEWRIALIARGPG